jgi:nitrogen fixation/metabolism regulation signal transduction histidine kinase
MENPIPKWAPQFVLALIAIFFILFGIDILYMAYQITDPFSFVMTFFASNLVILISATLLLGFILKMVATIKRERQEKSIKLRARD